MVAGAVGAVVVLLGGTALAGTGAGAVFNLGQVNTVNGQSALTGSTPNGAAVKIDNTGTGPSSTALKLQVVSGHPPFVTNGTGKVANLQADTVDGDSSNELARVVGSSSSLAWSESGRSTLQTLTITAPKPGFVVLSGSAQAYYSGGGCTLCFAHLRFRDVEANADTVASGDNVPASGSFDYVPLALTTVVPVSAGTHTFRLDGTWYSGNGAGVAPSAFYGASATATYVRYNGIGTAASSAAGAAVATPDPSPPGVRSRD